MRLVVLGAGSIGGGLGGACFRGGMQVHLVARGPHLEALRGGLLWRRPEGDELLPIPASSLEELEPREDDLVAIACKLQDAEPLLDQIQQIWGDPVLSMWTNGLIGDRWAAERFSRCVPCVVWVPASVPAPGQAALWGQPVPGQVALGPGGEALALAMSAGGLPCRVVEEISPLKHEKFIGNLAGAAQALVEDWIPIAQEAMAEGRAVLEAAGMEIGPSLMPEGLSLGSIGGLQRPGGSTRQSRLSGRSLETRWLNGELVELAEGLGVEVPVNRGLLELEASYEAAR